MSQTNLSPAQRLSLLPRPERRKLVEALSEDEQAQLQFDWTFWARPNQLAPAGDWRIALWLAGRGFGKTRVILEWVRAHIESGRAGRVALVAATAADTRDVLVEGEAGMLAIAPPWNRPRYESSKRRLTWPNGAIATLYSADEPDRLRGPEHDLAAADEVAAWRYPQAWDMLLLGLRLGRDPRVAAATTPRPTKLIKELVADPRVAVTKGTSYDNLDNLAPAFAAEILSKYQGTRLGRQEINAEILEDVPGALWTYDVIDRHRVKEAPELVRVVVGVDPEASDGESSAETGIIVAGRGKDGDYYVLADRTKKGSPSVWGRAAVKAYQHHKADKIVAEVNQGGDMVEHVIKSVAENADKVAYKGVHASRGKQTRAEPVSALYERGRVHHVGVFDQLEGQMSTWEPGQKSPDRMDALVWAITELMGGQSSYTGDVQLAVSQFHRPNPHGDDPLGWGGWL